MKRFHLIRTVDTDDNVSGGGGEVAEVEASGDTGAAPAEPKDGESLGEGGKRALASEREARKAAQRDLAAARETLEKLKAENDSLAKARDAAIAERDAQALVSARHTAAAAAGLPAFWADRLKGSTAEELEADAKALAEHLPAVSPMILPPDPSQGASTGGRGVGSVQAGRELFKSKHSVKE